MLAMRVYMLFIVILAIALAAPVSGAVSIGAEPLPADGAVTLPAPPGGEKGYFFIQSIPSGADVIFDNAFWGETPVTIPVSTTGTPSHSIRITLANYETWTSSYQGNPGPEQTITITATLIPSAQVGNIQVVSSPSGATATLDRSQSATTPYTFTNVPVSPSHEVSVYLSGYQTFYTNVNVNRGQTTYINAILTPTVTSGSLRVDSNPSGAAVYVDSIYRGVTSTIVGNLAPGTHSVRLSKAGYQDWTGTVSISAGATTTLSPILTPDQQPQYATVSITSNPPGANVYGDGVYVGQTRASGPLVFTQVVPGVHTILISKAGYQDYTATRTVVAGQNYDIDVTLPAVPNPTTGGISVTSSPSGAEVYLNNAFKGLTPITLESLTPGSYTVLLKLSGYTDWSATAQVAAGQTSQLTATLNPLPTPTPSGLIPVTIIAALGVLFLAVRRRSG
jgi:hypothetical protein